MTPDDSESLRRLEQHLNLNEKLREQSAIIQKDLLAALNHKRSLIRRRTPEEANKVRYPTGEFTIPDLEHINSTLDPSFVRVGLGEAIHSGAVNFEEKPVQNYSRLTLMFYRKKLHIS